MSLPGPITSSAMNRRTLLKGAGAGILAVALAPSLARAATIAEPGSLPPNSPAGFDYLGQAPDAAAVAHLGYAGSINTLHHHQGKVFYGYGDYNINSGSRSGLHTNVSFYDPATGTFEVALQSYTTEEINTFRSFNGHLFVPNIDPSGAPSTESFASDLSGVWARNDGVRGEHVYDVCDSTVPGEYFVCGAQYANPGKGATVWQTQDSGATWSELVRVEDDPNYDGYERFYWLARLGDTLYMMPNLGIQRSKLSDMLTFNLSSRKWGKVNRKKLETGWSVGYGGGWSGREAVGDTAPSKAADVVTCYDRAWFNLGTRIYSFNGKGVTLVTQANSAKLAVGDDGLLYLKHQGGIERIEPDGGLTRILSPESPDTTIRGNAFTVAGGKIYLSGQESSLFSRDLPIVEPPGGGGGDDDTGNGKGKGNNGKGKGKNKG